MNNESKENLKGSLLLLLAALIWGMAFVAQSVGMDYLGPFSFNGFRNILAGAVVFIYLLFRKKSSTKEEQHNEIKGGIICGIFLFFASSAQQIGLKYTSVGKAGFITALYIIIVPLLGIFIKKKLPESKIWISLALAVAGMYMLCIKEKLVLSKGDLFVFACAIGFSAHIISIDHFSPLVNAVKMSCIQFFVCGILSLFMAFMLEKPTLYGVSKSIWPLLYTSVLSSGVAYTLQVIAQRHTNPVIASLVMSLESIFSVLAGWLLLNQTLSRRESIGCVMVFAAVILAQIPLKRKIKRGIGI